MKTNDLLNQLSQNISDSYDIIETGGGAMPSDRVTCNLPDAIGTIPQPMPDVPLYGKVGYYPWSQARDISGDMVEIQSVDDAKLDEFLNTYPSGGGMSEFMYEQDWESEAPESNYVWRYFWQEGELKIQPEDFASTTGIQATLEEGTDWASINVQITKTVHTDQEPLVAYVASAEEFEAIGGSDKGTGEYVLSIGGKQVYNKAIIGFVVGSDITELPDNFLYQCSELTTIDMSEATILTIGPGAMYGCSKLNSPMDLSHCTTIGNEVLVACTTFNQPIDLSSCTSIGNYFLSSCTAFNSPVKIGAARIGDNFMASDTAFNSPLDISKTISIGTRFLTGCTYFSQAITFPMSLTSVGVYCMFNCDRMIADIHCEAPASVMAASDYSFSTTKLTTTVYYNGFNFIGTYNSEWKTKFPDRTTSPGRKLRLLIPCEGYVLVGEDENNTTRIPLTNLPEVCSSYNATGNVVIAGQTIAKRLVREVVVTSLPGQNIKIPDYFCSYMQNLSTMTLPSNANIAEVGNYFMYQDISFDGDISFPHVTKVGHNFLSGCQTFDSNLSLPSLTQIDSYSSTSQCSFLQDCYKFNKPVDISGLTTSVLSGAFMRNCKAFNSSLKLPNTRMTNITTSFLAGCESFNQPLNIPSNITSLGESFLSGCKSFNQPISINNVVSIGAGFLSNCDSFNQPLTIPSTLRGIGSLLAGCVNMVSTITVEAPVSIVWTQNNGQKVTLTSYDKTANSYVQGIPLAGTYATEWDQTLVDMDGVYVPNKTRYRKLIVAS